MAYTDSCLVYGWKLDGCLFRQLVEILKNPKGMEILWPTDYVMWFQEFMTWRCRASQVSRQRLSTCKFWRCDKLKYFHNSENIIDVF